MTPDDLKTFRAKLRWTQARLAQELGVTGTTVARWEQGVHAISPVVEKLVKTLKRRKP